MSTVIQAEMQELNAVVAELKEVNIRARELRGRKKDLEKGILEWLIKTDRPGCMYEDLVVMRGESKTHSRLKKAEKQAAMINILEEQGVKDAETVCQSIIHATAGETQNEPKLKIKIAGGSSSSK